jgi:hypothetical protein
MKGVPDRHTRLAKALDALNAFDALDTVRRKRYNTATCFGPAPFTSPAAPTQVENLPRWIGVLIWRRAPGYYGYKTLTLTGVWAVESPAPAESDAAAKADDGPITIIVGERIIPYTSDFYVAEAYFKLIRTTFTDYYSDDGRPAEAAPICTFDRARRLDQRTLLVAALGALA